ncbi:MAG: glycosyltransferase family 4 protein [Candidatus Nanoarchaeia archaeon]|jgi:glycosyltransferase involved in cell wall biosynthesis|nr:glycosyltransferase family 4 protein [Candidatus Nanoarchaeia archaeon]
MSNRYKEEDTSNHKYLEEKWSKKTIVFFSGPSWEKWDHRNVDQNGIGGSETWQVMISRELSKLGYRVINFNDCQEEIDDGLVKYFPYSRLHNFIEYNYVDYFISSRTTEPFRLKIRSNKKIVICHDIWLSSQNQVAYQEKVDKFLVLSEWHKNFVHQHHGISLDKLIMTSNGVDLKRFEKQIERHPYRLMYSSSLDRGLDVLLYLFDFIKVNVPELELHIFYGLDNWIKSAQHRPGEKEKIEAIQKAMNKPDVFYHGRVGQDQLAEEWLKSSLWAYPTDFEETNCITAIEAQAAGLPVLATNYAGLRTTVGNSGILLGNGNKGEANTREFRIEFASKCISLLKDRALWKEWSEKSLENAKKYSWANIAKQWVEQILC